MQTLQNVKQAVVGEGPLPKWASASGLAGKCHHQQIECEASTSNSLFRGPVMTMLLLWGVGGC